MRREEAGLWLVAAVGVVGLVGAAVVGYDVSEVVIFLFLGFIALIVGRLMATEVDGTWLPAMVVAGFIAKIAGAGLRYEVLQTIYFGTGDATRYHRSGLEFADIWRGLEIPIFSGSGGTGTRIVERIAGLLYVPYEPGLLGGFLMFAMLGFLGQLLFYAAFRRAHPRGRLRLYAAAVLFLPSLVFWPASIGKEAVMLLLIGLIAYAGSRLFERYEIRWILVAAAAMSAAAAIRPHMGALLGGALAIAMFLGRAPESAGARVRRWVIVGLAAAGLALVVGLSADRFGLDPNDLDIDPFLDELARRTGQGGSAVEGEAIRSIADVPQAVLRVLFRPLIFESFNALSLLSGIEGTALLLMLIWKLPRMVSNLGSLRRSPYLIFSLIYFIGFTVVFSPVLNLGILARQRTQVLPLLLALMVALGWPETDEERENVEENSLQRLATS